MYIYRPGRSNAFGIIFSSLTLTGALFLLFLNTEKALGISSAYYILSFLLFFVATVVFSRYVFTSYEYSFDFSSDTFTVKEFRGKRFTVRARLEPHDIGEIVEVERRKKFKRQNCEAIYDYRPDAFPKKYQVLILRSNNFCGEGKEVHILLQLDKKMLAYLRNMY